MINFGLGSSGIAQVADGVKGVGVNAFRTTVDISWGSPISQFGGYFAAATSIKFPDPIPVTVSFFANPGSLIGMETFSYSHSATGDGGLDWHGWVFAEPISSVSVMGGYFVMDGLQAVEVPEPRALGLAVLGAAALGLFSRRKPVSAPCARPAEPACLRGWRVRAALDDRTQVVPHH